MKKSTIIKSILQDRMSDYSETKTGNAFAPTNIALCKYWGKRHAELNLPITSSLSISLGNKGAHTQISHHAEEKDSIILNKQSIAHDTQFSQRLINFLNLFRPQTKTHYKIETNMNIPVAAGLASSACGAAALVSALDQLYNWQLSTTELSILARLGSGSAARSIWAGFVEWQAGENDNGMDSHGIPLKTIWPELRVGLQIIDRREKPISSREAMQRTIETSKLYESWPAQVASDLSAIKTAIANKDFNLLGEVSEANALAMHATMQSARPAIFYSQLETFTAMQKIWELRLQKIPVYFTQDAGPNLKLLFLQKNQAAMIQAFPNLEIIEPFLCHASAS